MKVITWGWGIQLHLRAFCILIDAWWPFLRTFESHLHDTLSLRFIPFAWLSLGFCLAGIGSANREWHLKHRSGAGPTTLALWQECHGPLGITGNSMLTLFTDFTACVWSSHNNDTKHVIVSPLLFPWPTFAIPLCGFVVDWCELPRLSCC